MGSSVPSVSQYLKRSAPASLPALINSISLSSSVLDASSALIPIVSAPSSLAVLTASTKDFIMSLNTFFPWNLPLIMISDVEIEMLRCFSSGQFLKLSLTSSGIALHQPSRWILFIAPSFTSSRFALI